MDITFDDSSGFDPETHCAGTLPWYMGDAAPVGSLSDFNGESTTGTWSLFVSDSAARDAGNVLSWELITEPALEGLCSVCSAGPGGGDQESIFSDGFESGDTTAWTQEFPWRLVTKTTGSESTGS